jgi:alpha-L-fucosidase 2
MNKFIPLLTILAGSAYADMKLIYNQPATDWQTQALPIGNGRLGAMIFGDPLQEHIQLNESSLWTGDEKNMGSYQNLGDLTFDLTHGPASAYHRELDITSAVHTITYTADGVKYRREYLASYPKHALLFHFESDKPGTISGLLKFTDAHTAASVAEGRTITATGKLENGLIYETQIMVLNNGGRVVPEATGIRKDALRISQADSLTIVVVAGTNYAPDRSLKWRGDHPHARISKDLADIVATASYEKIRREHQIDYRSLFYELMLNLGTSDKAANALPTDQRLVEYAKGKPDPELETLFFQYGRYLLLSSSRAGGLPANLQGLWNNSNTPPWRSDYHSNINLEMNYWPSDLTNLPECAVPFFDYVESLIEVRTEATHDYYLNQVDPAKVERKEVRGWTVQTENNIFGAGGFKWNPPGSAWYALQFWEHYAFTGDLGFLRSAAYPLLKDITEFWEDHLVALPDGRLVTPDGWSPEHGPEEKGVTYDQEIVWDLFTNFIEASTILDQDALYRAKITAMRDKLVTPHIGKWGQLQEWMEDRDDPKDDHRHISQLFALYPGRQISPITTPELANAAKVSLMARGDKSTGWAMAWRINLWARLLDGDHAYTLLRNLLHITGKGNQIDYGKGGGVYSNLFDAHPPFQIDGNFGATAGIAEMLLQSQVGEIHLLPALPKSWPNGGASGLRARGNINVNVGWKDGTIINATLTGPETRDVTVRYGDKTKVVHLIAKVPIVINKELDYDYRKVTKPEPKPTTPATPKTTPPAPK